jgi:hypothetical protein
LLDVGTDVAAQAFHNGAGCHFWKKATIARTISLPGSCFLWAARTGKSARCAAGFAHDLPQESTYELAGHSTN